MYTKFLFFLLITISLTPKNLLASEYTDFRGKKISLTQKPMRIASGALASDEILLDILNRSNEIHRLVALSTLADHPQYSNITEPAKKVKHRLGSDIEKLIALKPDLVILASYNKIDTITRIEQAGIKTFVLGNFSSLQDIENNIELLGNLIQNQKEAKSLKEEFINQLSKLKLTSDKKIAAINWFNDGVILGQGTIFDEILTLLSINNASHPLKIQGWKNVSSESLATLKPEVIIACGTEADKNNIIKTITQNKAWASLSAVKNKKIILVPEHELTATSHFVVRAIEKISQQIKQYR